MPCWCFSGMKCESDTECWFWHYAKRGRCFRDRLWSSQVQIGHRRVDAFICLDGERIAVELDGKAFHNRDLDDARDRELLADIDHVVHIPYPAIKFYPDATFSVLACWFPQLAIDPMGGCYSAEEMHAILAACEQGDYGDDFLSADQWIRAFEHDYEIWQMLIAAGCVGSPRAFVENWRTHAIRLASRDEQFPVTRWRQREMEIAQHHAV